MALAVVGIFTGVTSGAVLSFLVEEEEIGRRHEQRFQRCENSLSDIVNSHTGQPHLPEEWRFPATMASLSLGQWSNFISFILEKVAQQQKSYKASPSLIKAEWVSGVSFQLSWNSEGFQDCILQKPDVHQRGETGFFLATAVKLSLPWKTSFVCVGL